MKTTLIISAALFALLFLCYICAKGKTMHPAAPAQIENTAHYWQLIEFLCRRHGDDTEKYYTAADALLAAMPADSQRRFGAYTQAYLAATADCVWLDMACKAVNGSVSDDTSLYFNLWLISRGRAAFLNALKNPDSLADLKNIPYGNASFEQFMSLGGDADGELSAEEQRAIATELVFENGDRLGGFDSFDAAMAEWQRHTPRLCQGFAKWEKLSVSAREPDMTAAFAQMTAEYQAAEPTYTPPFWKPEDVQTYPLSLNIEPLHGASPTADGALICQRRDGKNLVVLQCQRTGAVKELFRLPAERQHSFCGQDATRLMVSAQTDTDSGDKKIPAAASFWIYDFKQNAAEEIPVPVPHAGLRHSASLRGDTLWFTLIADWGTRRRPAKMQIMSLHLPTRKFSLEIDNATDPVAAPEGLYFLSEEPDFTNTLKLKHWNSAAVEIIAKNTQNDYTAFDGAAVYQALEPGVTFMPACLNLRQSGTTRIVARHTSALTLSGAGNYLFYENSNPLTGSRAGILRRLDREEFYRVECQRRFYAGGLANGHLWWLEADYPPRDQPAAPRYFLNMTPVFP